MSTKGHVLRLSEYQKGKKSHICRKILFIVFKINWIFVKSTFLVGFLLKISFEQGHWTTG